MSELSLFRELEPGAAARFRQWARDNYVPGDPINPLWHPVVRDECERMTSVANLSFRYCLHQGILGEG